MLISRVRNRHIGFIQIFTGRSTQSGFTGFGISTTQQTYMKSKEDILATKTWIYNIHAQSLVFCMNIQTLTFLVKYMDAPFNSVSSLETFKGMPSLTFCSRPGIDFVQAERWLMERVNETTFQQQFVNTAHLSNANWQLMALVGSLSLDVREFIFNMMAPGWKGVLTSCQFINKRKTYFCGFGPQRVQRNGGEFPSNQHQSINNLKAMEDVLE